MINVKMHINRIKNQKKNQHCFNRCIKAFENDHPFMSQTLNKLEREGTNLNIVKSVHDRSAGNTILNKEKLTYFF